MATIVRASGSSGSSGTTGNSGGQTFDVRSYGATGVGSTHDDTAGFQGAVTAAIAVQGRVVIPPPQAGGYWNLTSTIEIAPTSGSQACVDIVQQGGAFNSIRWNGSGTDAIFHAVGWRNSRIEGVKIAITNNATGVVVWDLDTSTVANSTSFVTFSRCDVQLGTGINCVGWRTGHVSGGNGDVSFLNWENCFALGGGNTRTAGTRGWINEGANALNFVWVGGGGYFLDKMFTNASDAGATTQQGGSTMFFYGFGSTTNNTDFEFKNLGTPTIVGGRFELGHRFINVTGGAQHLAITVIGAEIDSYNPGDGRIISMDRPGTLILDGVRIYKTGTAYTSSMIYLGGLAPGLGSFIVKGGSYSAADPFWNITSATGAGLWNVYVQGATLLDGSSQAVTRVTDRP